VTKEVEKIITKEVPVEVEKIVTQQVEKIVTKVVEKAVPVTIEVEKAVDSRDGGELKVIAEASVAGLDSIVVGGGVNLTVAGHIYDQLFNLGEGFVALPQMLSDWSISSDGKSYSMTMRDGMTWHDGSPVTARDAVATMNRLLNSPRSPMKTVQDRLNSVTLKDEMTFVWDFHTTYGLLPYNLASMNLYPPIQPEAAVLAAGNEPITDYVGSGPFKLIKWDPGASIKMERFEEYKPRRGRPDGHAGGKKAFVDLLTWLEIPDASTRIVMLEAGQVDFVQTAPQDELNRLKENRSLQIYPHPLGRTPILLMKGSNPPFNDVKARQAVAAAIDAEEIMAAYGPPELWRVCGRIFGCDTRWDNTGGIENFNQRNIELGKKLLAESSYDGRVIDVIVPMDQPTIYPITQIAAPRLEAIGLNLNVRVTDWATFASVRNLPEGFHIGGTWGTAGHPLGPAGAFTNPGHYCSCSSEGQMELSEKFLLATTDAEKMNLATEKQKLYYEEWPWYQLGEFYSYHIGSQRVQGYPGMMGEPAFWNVWLED